MTRIHRISLYYRILRQQRRPVRFLLSRILRLSGLCRFFRIKCDAYLLNFHPAALALALWIDPESRDHDIKVIRRFLRPGGTYVDVGANIGQFAIVGAQAVGESGSVFAYEAHPQTALFLRQNIDLNRLTNVAVGQLAIGANFGWTNISDQRSDDQNNISRNGIPVPSVPLACLIDRKIDMLKIDVEGYELFVLKGLGTKIAEVSCIYFEVMDAHFTTFGYTFEDIHEHLASHGFEIFDFDEDGALIPVCREQCFPAVRNLIAARKGEIRR